VTVVPFPGAGRAQSAVRSDDGDLPTTAPPGIVVRSARLAVPFAVSDAVPEAIMGALLLRRGPTGSTVRTHQHAEAFR
jgi:hypothetical protein